MRFLMGFDGHRGWGTGNMDVKCSLIVRIG